MNSIESDSAYRAAVLEWQKRHRIADNDPLLASLELWEIFFSHRSSASTPSIQEPRDPIETSVRLNSDFSQEIRRMMQDIRTLPEIRDELCTFPRFATVFAGILGLVSGALIGKFIL